MDPLAQSLRAFRDSLYRCLDRRADALFELTDAILTAGSVPSPPHLSLAAVHRRGWGSLYAALGMGRMDEGGLRGLLSRHPLGDGDPGAPLIYAVDVSVWPRYDAETSPERGYYYHPSRHSTGQPIVAGWAYQLVAQLGFDRDSWVAPVDARWVRPTQDTDEVAAEQVRALVRGASATASAVDPDPRPAGFRGSLGGRGHLGEAPETLREVTRAPEGQPLWAGQASPGAQNGCLSKPKRSGSGYVLVFAVLA